MSSKPKTSDNFRGPLQACLDEPVVVISPKLDLFMSGMISTVNITDMSKMGHAPVGGSIKIMNPPHLTTCDIRVCSVGVEDPLNTMSLEELTQLKLLIEKKIFEKI